MIDFYSKPHYDFQDLKELVRILRAPDGCPWDRIQTHESIRRNFIEEVYEACEAIDQKSSEHLKEELGDVLMHVIFHAGIESDAGRFDLDDVCDAEVRKMVSRHPNLFGGETGLDWDEIKRREKGQTTLYEEMDAVARSLPALWRAEKLQKKAEKAGCIPETQPIALLCDAVSALSDADDPEAALGEILFSAVAAGRALGIDPEMALTARCDRFITETRDSHKNL